MGTYDQRGWNGNTAVVNGGQIGQVLVTFDGMAAQDSGAPSLSTYQTPSVDAIGEVKLLTGNYAAEYGARNGGQMNITTKNGTPQFHGSAYYYYRHEEFNANEFFNNQLGVSKTQSIGMRTPEAPSADPSYSPSFGSTGARTACFSSSRTINCGTRRAPRSITIRCLRHWNAKAIFRKA